MIADSFQHRDCLEHLVGSEVVLRAEGEQENSII